MGGIEPKIVKAPYRIKKPTWGSSGADFGPCRKINNHIAIYKSFVPSMDEGWTRFILSDAIERYCLQAFSIRNDVVTDKSKIFEAFESLPSWVGQYDRRVPTLGNYGTIIFPDQSPNQILNGYAKGSMPDEYTGGVGKEGVENLRKFVEAGGTLVFLNRASDFAIEQFDLPVRDVTKGLPRKDFYIPGSILRTELDLTSPIAKGMPKESIAWFENGPAFEIVGPQAPSLPVGSVPPAVAGGLTRSVSAVGSKAQLQPPATAGGTDNIRIIARYPTDPKAILLSGWALGAEKIAGKAALVEVTMGKGKIILFGFRPQYRGQSLATFPLLFNAISNPN